MALPIETNNAVERGSQIFSVMDSLRNLDHKYKSIGTEACSILRIKVFISWIFI